MPTEPKHPVSADVLAHASALRRLASGILGDVHAAEDVVQETWVRALQRPPADRGRADGMRGWLSAVARTLAFRRARGDGRRRERETRAVDQRQAGASSAELPAELLERRQALAHLTAAVLALEEPYQAAILLRFYDDLPPRAVAARLGVPLATAKSRIARGLHKLRERVEHDLAADGTSPRRAFAFLVGPALPVAPAPASQATGGGAAAATAGGLAMGINGKIAAGIAAAGLLGLATYRTLWRDAEPAQPESARVDAAARPDAELAGVEAIPLAAAGPNEARERLTAAAPGGFADATEEIAPDPYEFTLEGLVRDENDLAAAGAEVLVAPLGAPRNRAARTDADGRFRISWRGPARAVEVALQVRGAHGGATALRRLVVAAGTTVLPFRLPAPQPPLRAAWSGKVALAVANSADGLQLSARLRLDDAVAEAPPAWTPDFQPDADGAGAFALHPESCPAAGGGAGVLQTQWSEMVLSRIVTPPVIFLDAEVHSTPPPTGFTLSGTARDAAGEPVADALVVLGSAPGRGDGPRASTAADGTFRLEDVAAGTWYARAGGGDRGLATARIDAFDGGASRWEPWLERGLSLRGRLVDAASGAPLAGWSVDAENDSDLVADAAATDDDGRFAIPNLPRRALRLFARPSSTPPGAACELAGAVVPGGDSIDFEVEVAADVPGALVRVVGDDDRTVQGAEVRLWNLSTGRGTTLQRTEDGYATHAKLPAGTYAVEALIPGRAPLESGPLRLGGAERADLGLLRVAERGEVRVRDDGGAEWSERWLAALWQVRDDARLLVSRVAGALPGSLSLPEGRYELDLAPNPEHAAVRELCERGRAPAARRLAFDVVAGERQELRLVRGPGSAQAAIVASDGRREPDDPDVARAVARLLEAAEGEPGFDLTVERVQVLQVLALRTRLDVFAPRTTCTNCH
jgi:RNA polymerase sigma-70 factor (ECF subfamily)